MSQDPGSSSQNPDTGQQTNNMYPKKARPSFKAGVAKTYATNMADSSVVASATQIVHEGTNKNTPGEKNCTSSQKALAADKDPTHKAESRPAADATQVADEGDVGGERVRFIVGSGPAILYASMSAFLAPRMAARDSKTRILISLSVAQGMCGLLHGNAQLTPL